jgi:hypothetical protein
MDLHRHGDLAVPKDLQVCAPACGLPGSISRLPRAGERQSQRNARDGLVDTPRRSEHISELMSQALT